jgi:hypothetical protein
LVYDGSDKTIHLSHELVDAARRVA